MNDETNEVPTEDTNLPVADTPEAPTEGAEATTQAEVDIKAVAANIQANYDFNVTVRPTAYHFKSVTDPDTKIKSKRPSINLAIPYVNVQGIIDILEKDDNEKEVALLLDCVEGVISQQARTMISDDETITAETLDVDKLSWQFIANMPRPERTGGGIPKETWEAFIADYCDIMPEITGKKPEQVATAGKLLLNKFAAIKTNVPALTLLQEQLSIYVENSADIETYLPCVEFLTTKLDTLLNLTEEDLLAGL